MERIDKVFSNLGLMSRSECKKAVKQGLIEINGLICKSSDTKVDPDSDQITWRGVGINSKSYVYYMLYKPTGVITANHDEHQPTVMGLIDDTRTDLSAVGRLDKDTTGLLLITNDGKLNHRLLSPTNHVPKRYEAFIDGHLSESAKATLESGVDIGDDEPTLPARLEILETITCDEGHLRDRVALTITEGRFHQVKRMFEAVGCPVLRLHRSDFGALHLDENLAPGEYRELSDEELACLMKR